MSLFCQTVVVVCTAVLAGCHDVPEAPPELTVTLSATTAWSGGTVRLVSAGFAGLKTVPRVYLGSTSVPVTVVDDSTLGISLPQVTGSFGVLLILPDQRIPLGALRLVGFRDSYAGPLFTGAAYWRVPGGPPVLLGNGDSGAALFYLSSNTVLPVAPDSVQSPDCTQGVGPAAGGDSWVFSGHRASGCRTAVWSLSPSVHIVDSVGGLSPPGGEAWWAMTQPSPGHWLYNCNNFEYFVDCTGGACVTVFGRDPGGPWTTLMSPQGNRFTLLPADLPAVVYDARTLDTSYVTRQYHDPTGGAFSYDGDTLYLTEQDSADHWLVVAHRAVDGTVLTSYALDGLVADSERVELAAAVALDPIRPWLYAVLDTYSPNVAGLHVTLVVFDRGTGRRVGVTMAPGDHGYELYANPQILVPSPSEHLVYVVSSFAGYQLHGYHPTVWRFDTP